MTFFERPLLLVIGLCAGLWSAAACAQHSAIPAPGATANCQKRCLNEQIRCVKKLGTKRRANCESGFDLCLQRCDPVGYNNGLADQAHRAQHQRLRRRDEPDGVLVARLCEQDCDMGRHTCTVAGNDASACSQSRRACLARCPAIPEPPLSGGRSPPPKNP